jgi:iron complex outermembrane recepter protein
MNRVAILKRGAQVASLLAALAAIALPASAQGPGDGMPVPGVATALDSVSIEGVVVDARTGVPLPGTLVRIVALGRQDLTHQDGDFHLLNLPPGRHTLVFERIGYARAVREVTAAPGEAIHLVVELRPSAIELPGLIVTGTVGARLGDESVRPTTVVAGQELLRRMDLTLAATLRHEPGMASTSMGPATGRPVIRGLGGDRVLVLEDGMRVGDLSAAGADHAVAVDPLNARRIEVVRGPAALLYGSNAIGGVINIIRDDVPASLPDRFTGTTTLQAQSVNRGVAAGASGELPVQSWALRGELLVRDAGDLNTPAGPLGNTALRSRDASLGASLVETWGHIGAAYRYYDNSYGVPGGFIGAHPHGVDVEMRRHAVHAEAQYRPGGGPFAVLDASYNYTNYYHRELEDVGIIGTEFGLLTSAAELVARHGGMRRLGEGALGVRVEWQDFAAGGAIGTPPAKEWSVAGFFLEELELGPVDIQVGGRYDWHRITPRAEDPASPIGHVRTRDFGSLSGSIGAHYDFGHGWHLGASLARAYRTPSVTELFSQGPHLAAYSFETGNPDLRAEFGLGADIFLRVGRDDVRGELAVFRNHITNFIYYANTGAVTDAGLPIYQAVGNDAVLSGAEVGVDWNMVPGFVVEAVASYVRGRNRGTGEPLAQMPPLHGELQLRYEQPAFFAGAGWRGAAAQDRVAESEFETRTAGYSIFGATAGYRWVSFGRVHAVTLRAENITNVLYRDHLSRVREIMPEAGRNISVTYRLSF